MRSCRSKLRAPRGYYAHSVLKTSGRPHPAWFTLGVVVFAFMAAAYANDVKALFASFVFACMAALCGYYVGVTRGTDRRQSEGTASRQ
jgi:hypothetical protein